MTGTRRWLFALAAVLMMSAGFGARTAHAQTSFYGSVSSGSFDIGFFYDELDDYGRWVDYGDYGACWVPADVGYGWRPYMRGYWTYTDYGWTWASYEPFGWATYHYGRWIEDPYYGWVWVPGTVWAPAWVAWREADDCIGWAPLPPQVGWSVSVGLTFGNYRTSSIPYDRWCFVDRYRFDSRDVSRIVYPVSRNEVVFRRSSDATRFRSRDGSPFNEGIRIANLERTMGRQIPRMRVRAVDSPERGQGRQLDARTVGFFRPTIRGSRSELTQRVERRGFGNRNFERSNGGEARDFQRGRNLREVQREVQRQRDVRDFQRGQGRETRDFQRPERNPMRDFQRGRSREVQQNRETRDFQRPERREVRQFQREERGGGPQFQREERGGGRFQREERGGGRQFQREERGSNGDGGRGFQRESAPERREVRQDRGNEERGRDREARSNDSERRGNDNGNDRGNRGRGHGKKGD